MKTDPNRGANGGQGMNWIKQDKRLAIYMRDGLACAYCSASVEEGTQLTLDHIRARSDGGSNEESNLVTSCFRCNSSRGDRRLMPFCKAVAGYLNHGISPVDIHSHVMDCLKRPLDRTQAKEMISRRGSCAKVLANLPPRA